MQSSNEHGVVLIAFGSAASEMDQTTIEAMLTAISRMKQKFIWKLEGEFLIITATFVSLYCIVLVKS